MRFTSNPRGVLGAVRVISEGTGFAVGDTISLLPVVTGAAAGPTVYRIDRIGDVTQRDRLADMLVTSTASTSGIRESIELRNPAGDVLAFLPTLATTVGNSALGFESAAIVRARTTPTSDFTFAAGPGTTVDADQAVAIGSNNRNDADRTVVVGASSTITGEGANGVVLGPNNTLNDSDGFIAGTNVTVSGRGGVGVGRNITIDALEGFAAGTDITIRGDMSHAIGDGITIDSDDSDVIVLGGPAQRVRLNPGTVPTSANSPGRLGDYAADSDHIYLHNGTQWESYTSDATFGSLGRVTEVVTPTASITFTQAELDALDTMNPTITRNVMVNSVAVATATVTAVVEPMGIGFNHTVTLDTLVAGWNFTDATLGTADLPFTLVVGMEHEWTAGYPGGNAIGNLVINVADTSVESGVFWINPPTGLNARLNNVEITQALIAGQGFQTEVDAREAFQLREDSDNPYIRRNDTVNLVTDSELRVALPITKGRGPVLPPDSDSQNGDEFYLCLLYTSPSPRD